MSTPAPRCYCIICHEEKSSKGIHSHYLVSHTSAGKKKLDRARHSAKHCDHPRRNKSKEDKITKYNLNPNKCTNCSKDISYNKRNNKFCCSSCAASFNNLIRTVIHKPHIYPKRVCKVSFCSACNTILPNVMNKFCDKCRSLKRSNCAKERCKTIPFGGHTSKTKIYFNSKQGFECYLQSSYEITVAVELDANNIKWSRPTPFKWIDNNNKEHRYYPDFYLPEYNVYLDPKNSYLMTKDLYKITSVRVQNNINILMLSIDNLSWDKISKLIVSESN